MLYDDTVTLFCRIADGQYEKTCLSGVRILRRDGIRRGAEARSGDSLELFIPLTGVRTVPPRTYVSPEDFSPALADRCYTLRPGQDLICPGRAADRIPPDDAYTLTDAENRRARLPRLHHRHLRCRR